MRILIAIFLTLLLSSCAGSNYRYQGEQNPMQYKGQNIAAVEKQWGMASNIMHARNGTSYYMYNTNSTSYFNRSTTSNFSVAGTNEGYNAFRTNNNNNVTLKCTTVFTTDKTGTIINVAHQGADCGGEWVPKSN